MYFLDFKEIKITVAVLHLQEDTVRVASPPKNIFFDEQFS